MSLAVLHGAALTLTGREPLSPRVCALGGQARSAWSLASPRAPELGLGPFVADGSCSLGVPSRVPASSPQSLCVLCSSPPCPYPAHSCPVGLSFSHLDTHSAKQVFGEMGFGAQKARPRAYGPPFHLGPQPCEM